jgi:hypothetical protein
MLIDCGLIEKDLKDGKLFCHDWDSETNEEWHELGVARGQRPMPPLISARAEIR